MNDGELLPIIIVVSLLAFFIVLMLIILAWQLTRSRSRRKERLARTGNTRPTRQLTVRSGKVIPVTQAMQQRDTRFQSVNLCSVGSGKSIQGLFAPEVQVPAPAHTGTLCHFNAFADPEDQLPLYDRWEANDKALRTLGEQHLKPLKPPVKRGLSDTRKASITESLVKAYQGPPVPGSEPIELPANPLSRPLITRKTSMKKPLDHPDNKNTKSARSPVRSKSVGRSKTSYDQKVRFQPTSDDPRRNSEGGRPSRLKYSLNSEDIPVPPLRPADLAQLPTPPFIGTPDNFRNSVVEASEDFRTSLDIYDRAPRSFFSNSPSSSVVSDPIAPLSTGVSPLSPSAPNFSPLTPSQAAVPSPLSRGIPNNPSPPSDKDKGSGGSPKYKQKRPADIDTTSYLQRPYSPHRDSTTSFIDSSSTTKTARTPTRDTPQTPRNSRTPKEIRDLHRGPSVMSNRSDVTCAASDVSTTWTFGNARQMSIVPSVAPQELSMPPVQRPKSKYRSAKRVKRVEGRGGQGHMTEYETMKRDLHEVHNSIDAARRRAQGQMADMKESTGLGEQLPLPPDRLFERLAQIGTRYTWDQSIEPFHSSYDNWHVFGIQHRGRDTTSSSSIHGTGGSTTTRSSPRLGSRPSLKHYDTSSTTTDEQSSARDEDERTFTPVIARISSHALRIEREFHLCRTFIQTSDPDCNHTVRLIDLIRLPGHHGGGGPLVVSIFESPGRNYLADLVDFGQAWLRHDPRTQTIKRPERAAHDDHGQISLLTFLDFAIGASECLELLHHGLKVIHGELRADAFHFNRETRAVKLVNFGSGPGSFEHGLTSAGWSRLSKELGIKNKLQFIAPEQTGRMSAEPDSRTDIYSFGVLLWTMLTGEPAFDGEYPIDILQAVLNKRIPSVSSKRMDIPDIISSILQKMTQKQIDERYHSISGLKYDFKELQRILGEGDAESLINFQIGTKDVSSLFMLPTETFGRAEEHEKLVAVIDRVSKTNQSAERFGSGVYGLASDSTSTTSDRFDNIDDTRSNSASSHEAMSNRNSSSIPTMNGIKRLSQTDSQGAKYASGIDAVKPPLEASDSRDSVQTTFSVDTFNTSNTGHTGAQVSQWSGTRVLPPAPSKPPPGHKYRKRRKCEVVVLSAEPGMGKSSLLQAIQGDIRRRSGYSATAKFEPGHSNPFESFFRSISSLFRQIFSESDVSSEYHNHIRRQLKQFWPTLSSVLDLPESLISSEQYDRHQLHSVNSQSLRTRTLKVDQPESLSMHSVQSSVPSGGHFASSDSGRGGACTKSMKLINMFVEVLRVLATSKLICLCLDDLQYGDGESLELLASVIARKLGIVLIISCRDSDELSDNVKAVLDGGSANVTRVKLPPLSEDEVVSFVATTMHSEREYVLPLAIVCSERSHGNPFYLRQMLEICHRKGCIWYTWKESAWRFDLDRVFAEFETETYGQQSNTDFLTKRLLDLPPATRTILAWASLLGRTFSFRLLQQVLIAGSQYDGEYMEGARSKGAKAPNTIAVPNLIEGLNAALQAFILKPSDDEDHFDFAHDRYVQASSSLNESYDVERMHFTIARTMMSETTLEDDSSLYAKARHIRASAKLIRLHISDRQRYREIMMRAARKAIESGSRSTALQHFEVCLSLMQADPWTSGYAETLEVYTKAAELYWHQGQFSEANGLVHDIIINGRTAPDRAPAWVIQSRLLARKGNLTAAFDALKTSMAELGLTSSTNPIYSWDICDTMYHDLRKRILITEEADIAERPIDSGPDRASLGMVVAETISAAFWNDALFFQIATMTTINYHFKERVCLSQFGLALGYFAMLGQARSREDLAFTSRVHRIAQQCLDKCTDPSTIGRGLAVLVLFTSHLLTPLSDHIETLQEAMEHGLTAGDKHLFLFCCASIATVKLYLGHDMAEIELYCTVSPEDFGDWERDIRGGVLLIACRQVARALQGKTWTESADGVMSDDSHDTNLYLDFIRSSSTNPNRSLYLYKSLQIIPLYMFGYYDEAIELGNSILVIAGDLFSIRNHRLTLFYLSLSLIAKARESTQDIAEHVIGQVIDFKKQIELWQSECNTNYLMWSALIEAEICDLTGEYHQASQAYERAIDHTQLHDFMLEQALAFELLGDFYIRRGAKRAARTTLLESCALYSRISASGKKEQVTAKHGFVLQSTTTARTADAAVQTVDMINDVGATHLNIADHNRQETRKAGGQETATERTSAWVGPTDAHAKIPAARPDVSNFGLDILDLQTILEFNQAISSELQLDLLLVKMTEITLEFTGAQADWAGIVIKDEERWSLAASGTPEAVSASIMPILDIADETRKQILAYTIRFKEILFLTNSAQDERFCDAPTAKSVISLPIIRGADLLGVLYLEGRPNSFTDRNLGVLQLFCVQVGISIANSLLFMKLQKVSASNISMIASQKRALAQAREAEIKAKRAEAEALESVRLKEEAAKAKSMFLANVSHELRTPLNGVIGMSELLKGSPLNPEQEGYADSIRVCADTLLTVINDILDFSKLEAGKMQLFSVPLNLKDTISEVVRALSYTNLEKDLQTIEDLDLDPKALVVGDPVRLHQIFMNLLSNSYKFTAEGSVTVRSKIEHEDRKTLQVTFSVADTGIGITQEQVSRLFKPFSQADSSTQRSYGGSGLGLSICKALVNVLNGKIWLESQLGVGTTVFFTLTFPKAASATATASNATVTTREPDPMATWSSDADGNPCRPANASAIDLSLVPREQIRICIAEDNPINQKIAVSFVTKLGFKSEAYSDGLQAVEALRRKSIQEEPFHLVLMDVQMPVLDGYDATKLLRQDEDPNVRNVLVIAMTASAIRGDREKCLDAGMNNYLAKPVRAAVLKAMLEEYLSQAPRAMGDLQRTAAEVAEDAMAREKNGKRKGRKEMGKERPGLEKKTTVMAIKNGDVVMMDAGSGSDEGRGQDVSLSMDGSGGKTPIIANFSASRSSGDATEVDATMLPPPSIMLNGKNGDRMDG